MFYLLYCLAITKNNLTFSAETAADLATSLSVDVTYLIREVTTAITITVNSAGVIVPGNMTRAHVAACLFNGGGVPATYVGSAKFRCILPPQLGDVTGLKLWYRGTVHGSGLGISVLNLAQNIALSTLEFGPNFNVSVSGGLFMDRWDGVYKTGGCGRVKLRKF